MKQLLTLFLVLFLSSVAFGQKNIELKIGATPAPHAEILEFIKDDLKKEGIDLKIVIFSDYNTPNIALNDKSIDANFFQHIPYLEAFASEKKMDLVHVGDIFIAPIGFYSNKFKKIDDIKNGSTIAIPNDPTNGARALLLLQSEGIIKLKENAGIKAKISDIIENPKNLKFKELDAAQLPRILRDVDGAVINCNYAIEAGLNPIDDAIFLEDARSPYVNVIAVRKENVNSEAVKKLVDTLRQEKVRDFIFEKYVGSIIPVY